MRLFQNRIRAPLSRLYAVGNFEEESFKSHKAGDKDFPLRRTLPLPKTLGAMQILIHTNNSPNDRRRAARLWQNPANEEQLGRACGRISVHPGNPPPLPPHCKGHSRVPPPLLCPALLPVPAVPVRRGVQAHRSCASAPRRARPLPKS